MWASSRMPICGTRRRWVKCINHVTPPHSKWRPPQGQWRLFTRDVRAPQNNLAKIYGARNISFANFKVKLLQNFSLRFPEEPRTKLQLENLIRTIISATHTFREFTFKHSETLVKQLLAKSISVVVKEVLSWERYPEMRVNSFATRSDKSYHAGHICELQARDESR